MHLRTERFDTKTTSCSSHTRLTDGCPTACHQYSQVSLLVPLRLHSGTYCHPSENEPQRGAESTAWTQKRTLSAQVLLGIKAYIRNFIRDILKQPLAYPCPIRNFYFHGDSNSQLLSRNSIRLLSKMSLNNNSVHIFNYMYRTLAHSI